MCEMPVKINIFFQNDIRQDIKRILVNIIDNDMTFLSFLKKDMRAP